MKAQPLPAPTPWATPCQRQQCSAWQEPQPQAQHSWAHRRLWQVEVGSPSSDLWERKGSGTTPT